jgi:hypothetical protein
MKKVLARTAKQRATRAQALSDIAAAHSAAATGRLEQVTGKLRPRIISRIAPTAIIPASGRVIPASNAEI